MHLEFDALRNLTDFLYLVVAVAIAVVSYRRSQCLSGYPMWKSALIGLASGGFILVWLVMSWVNRRRIAAEWRDYRTRPAAPSR